MKFNSNKIFILLAIFAIFISISSISAAEIDNTQIDNTHSVVNDLNIDTYSAGPVTQDNGYAFGPITQDNALGAVA